MSDVRQQIEELIQNNKVVLFMKGTRSFPQCGFSARAIEVFKRCGVTVKDVNVLADPTMRQGIKDYSNWPTIPQAYVGGQFVGGSDILLEMYESGELQKLLGVEPASAAPAKAPTVTITRAAQAAFASAGRDAGSGEVLRFDVSPTFQYDLFFGPTVKDDFVIQAGALTVHVSRGAAARADGVTIDFVDGPTGSGFKIDNPNEPAKVRTLSAKELKAKLDGGEALHLFDVRGEKERAVASIAGARPLEDKALAGIAKDAMVVLHCHHGVRSRSAAEQLVQAGFRNVWNLTGGIDAWSVEVDPGVARY
ncbi:MAG: Grx4 family monothiol glutaredoxin [Deltaproteobacteria bacterium]|nr:Grx4 family monothiol glutaredoxin [Deltaproteobacteria bacterium]